MQIFHTQILNVFSNNFLFYVSREFVKVSAEGAKLPISPSVLKLWRVSAEGAKKPIGIKIVEGERRRREEAHRS